MTGEVTVVFVVRSYGRSLDRTSSEMVRDRRRGGDPVGEFLAGGLGLGGRPTGIRRRTQAVPATRPRATCRGEYGLPGGTAVRRVSGRSRALELDPRGEAVLCKAVVRLLGGRPPGGKRHQPRQPDLCIPADQVDPGLARLAHLIV